MKILTALLAILLLAASVPYCADIHPAHVLIAADRSGSMQEIKADIIGIADESLDLPSVESGSKLILIGSGNTESANEPVHIFTLEIPKEHRLMEGKPDGSLRKSFLNKVNNQINELEGSLQTSPIYMSVYRGVETLRAQRRIDAPGPGASTSYLYIVTDGRENVEPALKTAINGSGDISYPPEMIIDNTDIKIIFCGLSNTNDNNKAIDSTGAIRLEQAWRAVFSDPQNVIFSPYCPRKEVE